MWATRRSLNVNIGLRSYHAKKKTHLPNRHHPAHTCAETAGAPYPKMTYKFETRINQSTNERQQPSSLKSSAVAWQPGVRLMESWEQSSSRPDIQCLATTLDGALHGEKFQPWKKHRHISSMVIPAMQDKHWADLIAKSESSHVFENFWCHPRLSFSDTSLQQCWFTSFTWRNIPKASLYGHKEPISSTIFDTGMWYDNSARRRRSECDSGPWRGGWGRATGAVRHWCLCGHSRCRWNTSNFHHSKSWHAFPKLKGFLEIWSCRLRVGVLWPVATCSNRSKTQVQLSMLPLNKKRPQFKTAT